MTRSKGKTLVVSRNPQLADIRKTVLETAGFTVIAATDDSAVEQACSMNGIQLIMLGYSLAPADKRRVWAKSRQYCNVPIVELHKGGRAPELVDRNVFAHESKDAKDFLHSVETLFMTTTPPQGLRHLFLLFLISLTLLLALLIYLPAVAQSTQSQSQARFGTAITQTETT